MASASAIDQALQKLVDSDILSHADATGIKDMLKEKEKERKFGFFCITNFVLPFLDPGLEDETKIYSSKKARL